MSPLLLLSLITVAVAIAFLWGGRVLYPTAPCRTQTILKWVFMLVSAMVGVLFTILASLSFRFPFDEPDRWWPLGVAGMVIATFYYEKLTESKR